MRLFCLADMQTPFQSCQAQSWKHLKVSVGCGTSFNILGHSAALRRFKLLAISRTSEPQHGVRQHYALPLKLVKALEEELARARSYLAAERVRITQVEGALAQERDLRLGLTKLAAQRGHMCERAGADLSSLAMQREEWMQDRSELTFANQRLAMGAVEYNRLNAENHRLDAELRETRRRLAESQYQLSSLNQSLNVGAAWLSGSDDMIFKARPAYQNA